MRELVKAYGRGLSTLFVLIVTAWVLLLIIVPQYRMLERAFTYENRGGAKAMLALDINRAYTDKFALLQERDALLAAGSTTGAEASTFAPSPNTTPSPSAAPSPSRTPSPSPSSGFAPSPNGQNSAGADAKTRSARLAELNSKIATLSASISKMEAKEGPKNAGRESSSQISLKNFTTMSPLHLRIFLMTLFYALTVTILSFVICYPVAYAAAVTRNQHKLMLILLGLVIPYAINELLRIFSWVMILEKDGILNHVLNALGLINLSAGEGVRFVASNWAVFTVMVYAYVLFMVFPIYNTIDTLDKSQIEAARDLGAASWRIHARIVIPHAKPGIAVGAIMTFMLSAGTIAVPEIVGRGMHPDWFSQLIYRRFFEADSWNQGSAYSLALLAACVVFILANMAIFKVGVKDIAK